MLTSSASARIEVGQQAGQPRRQHRLAGAGRADHQQVVAAGGGDLHRALGGLHALHVGQVRARAAASRHAGGLRRGQHLGAAEMVDQRQQVGGRQHLDAPGPGRLAALARRADQARDPASRRRSPPAARRRPGSACRPATVRRAPRSRQTSSRGTTSIAASTPSAIGRSKWLPSFSRSAGARLISTRRGGSARPMAASAARTRSRASPTALSGRPTSSRAGSAAGDLHLHLDRHRLDAGEGEACARGRSWRRKAGRSGLVGLSSCGSVVSTGG